MMTAQPLPLNYPLPNFPPTHMEEQAPLHGGGMAPCSFLVFFLTASFLFFLFYQGDKSLLAQIIVYLHYTSS
jgi:hypothetical protein